MSKLKSIFGAYADNMQLVIDSRNDRFAPLWFPKYFSFGTPQVSLTYSEVIGASRLEAAASVVDRDAETPLRSRPDLSKMSGSIPAIREMFALKESDMREYEVMKAMPVSDATKRDQILNLIFDDVKKAGNSVFKRIDIMSLEAVSKGYISLTTTNNPDGIVSGNVDLLMPSENKKQSAVSWATSATATPLTDFETVISAGKAKGVSFVKVLISPTVWSYFRKAKEVIDTLTAFYYAAKPGGGFNPVAISTVDRVNEYLTANRMPIIEIVDESIGIEKDGKINAITPFSDVNAVFIPSGNLGVIKHAIAMEEINKVENVAYAKFAQALISKWKQNEPLREWTKAELNAFPTLGMIDSIFHLEAVHA